MKDDFIKVYFGLGEYYSKELTSNQLLMYVEDVMDAMSYEEFLMVVKKYRTIPENKFFPLPSQLIDLLRPNVSGIDEANEVANLIIKAMSSCGYTNPEKARASIGSLGWEVVLRLGGWTQVCQNTMNNEVGIFRAQIRGLVEVVAKRAKRGELDETPSLQKSNEVGKLISSTMKRIE